MVNEIVTRVINDVQSHLHTMAPPPSVMPDLAPSTITPVTTDVPQATANHLSADNLLTQLLQQNQEITKRLMENTTISPSNEPKPRRQPKPSTGPRQGKSSRPIPDRIKNYCWTHGRCIHSSKDCQSKAPNDNEEVIMQNKMGGSAHDCP